MNARRKQLLEGVLYIVGILVVVFSCVHLRQLLKLSEQPAHITLGLERGRIQTMNKQNATRTGMKEFDRMRAQGTNALCDSDSDYERAQTAVDEALVAVGVEVKKWHFTPVHKKLNNLIDTLEAAEQRLAEVSREDIDDA